LTGLQAMVASTSAPGHGQGELPTTPLLLGLPTGLAMNMTASNTTGTF
jgi:hypothetical protein